MGNRKEKHEKYVKEQIQEFTEAVTEAYLNPPSGYEDVEGHSLLKDVASEFDITPLKVRKILITSGAYHTDISDIVNDLKCQGKSIKEIQQITGLGRASVHGYLPYEKGIYNLPKHSLQAERVIRYRSRKALVERLTRMLYNDDIRNVAEVLWDTLVVFQNYPFKTVKGLRYTYEIKGNEIFFDRKSKSVTRATVNIALEKVLKLKADNIEITGPKKIGCFGASYLYPVFKRIGLIAIT